MCKRKTLYPRNVQVQNVQLTAKNFLKFTSIYHAKIAHIGMFRFPVSKFPSLPPTTKTPSAELLFLFRKCGFLNPILYIFQNSF